MPTRAELIAALAERFAFVVASRKEQDDAERVSRRERDDAVRMARQYEDAEIVNEIRRVAALPDVTPTPTPPPEKPSAPTNLTVDVGVPGKATLRWEHDGKNVTEFYPHWQDAVTGDTPSEDIGPAVREYTFTLSPGSYTFSVGAEGPGGETDSATVTAEVKAPPVIEQPGKTPWPLPPKAGEKWIPRPIADAPAYPAAPAIFALEGSNLANLTVDTLLPPGDYVTSGDIKVNIVGTLDADGRPTLCRLKLKPGQSITVKNFAGVTVEGGSAEGDNLEKNASIFGSPGCIIHTCRVTGGEGSGVFLSGADGAQLWYTEIDHCESGGVGGTKSDDIVIRGNYVHHCNLKYGRRNTHKGTRLEDQLIADNVFDQNRGGNWWQDNYCNRETRGTIARNYFGETTTDNKDQAWSVFAIRTELNGAGGVDILDNYVVTFYSCDETRNAVVRGNVFVGKVYRKVIELRNKKRGTPPMWLENILIDANTFLDNTAEIAPSNDVPGRLKADKIVVTETNRWPDGRIKEHVTVKE